MKKGDSVIANHPESGSREFVRSYGIVQEMTKSGGVVIELADGSLINRQINSVAVYIQPPSNWLELFRQKQTVYSQPRHHMIVRRSTPQKSDM